MNSERGNSIGRYSFSNFKREKERDWFDAKVWSALAVLVAVGIVIAAHNLGIVLQ